MHRMIIVIALSIFISIGAFVYLMYRLQAEPDVAEQLPVGIMQADDRTIPVELALTMGSQTRGLSYRESLDPDRGMLFVYSRPSVQRFWMYEMRFPLDMIFIDGDTVVDIAANVPAPDGGIPKTVTSAAPADKVLEINAGKAEEWGIKVGSSVVLR